MEKELRYSTIESGSNEMIVEGYAIVFDQRTMLYEVEGVKYYETIDRQSLNNTDLKDVCLKYNHGDNGKILARTRNNTLELKVDDKGLFIKAKIAETTDGKDLYELIKRGDLDKMSFAFIVDDDDYDGNTHTRIIRSIKKVFEVSIVDTPAYEGTSIIAKRCKDNFVKEYQLSVRNDLLNKLCGNNYQERKTYNDLSIEELKIERLDRLKNLITRNELNKQNKKINNGGNSFLAFGGLNTLDSEKECELYREYEELLREYRGNTTYRKRFLPLKELKESLNIENMDFREGYSFTNIKEGEDKMEKREFSKELLEKRSALLSSGVLIPQIEYDVIQPKFNDVSGILDLVQIMPINEGNSFKVPYVKSTSVGHITTEQSSYNETATTFGTAEINAQKITAFFQYSEEVEKLPAAKYEAYIVAELSKIIKRKMVEQVVKGNNSSQFSGLYDTTVVQTSADLEIAEINSKTLNDIIYGHDTESEEVEGNNVLFLNKKDLGAFANVTDSSGNHIYNIVFSDNGQTGHINGTKFCICNSLNALSDPLTEGENYTMVYMDPTKYMLAIFGPIEIKKDYSTGFRTGIISVKANAFAGGSAVSQFGITRIKKA